MNQAKESVTASWKEFEFPISRDYVRHWGLVEAAREIIQNALDADSPFDYQFRDDRLFVYSRHSVLAASTLLLGKTSKADDESAIGSFGEGYKLALLVLTREGHNPVIWNNGKKWTCAFRHSDLYGAEIFVITEEEADPEQGVTFEIANLSTTEKADIIESCLQMQRKDAFGEVLGTKYGTIMPDRKGKLYVNGLFVCDTELEFSYNMKPRYMRLERDRQTISNWDLLQNTKSMWFDANCPDRVAALMERNCKDLEYAEYGAPELIREACYKLFREKHPTGVVARNQEEMAKLVKKGMEVKIYSGGGYYSAVTSSSGYSRQQESVTAALKEKTPLEKLEEYFMRNKKYMRTPAIVELKELIKNHAGKWK